jgi:hypothetical protein
MEGENARHVRGNEAFPFMSACLGYNLGIAITPYIDHAYILIFLKSTIYTWGSEK